MARARSVVLGAALGASVGLPAGLLHDKLVELMPEDARAARRARQAQTEAIIRGDSAFPGGRWLCHCCSREARSLSMPLVWTLPLPLAHA